MKLTLGELHAISCALVLQILHSDRRGAGHVDGLNALHSKIAREIANHPDSRAADAKQEAYKSQREKISQLHLIDIAKPN